MNRLALLLAANSLLSTGQAFAQKSPAVVIARSPSQVCPQTDLGDMELSARYRVIWERYIKAIEEAGSELANEIETQRKSATSSGNLDLALYWKSLAEEFEQKGEVRWDEARLKETWSKKFRESSYPHRFNAAVKKASEAFASAIRILEKGYEELVTELTKAEKFEHALKVRNELKELIASSSLPEKPEPKSEPKPQASRPNNGKYRFVFGDGTGKGLLLELRDETLWIHGDIHPTKPSGISMWPKPRAVPCRMVGAKILTDDGDPRINKWRCAITWDTKSGAAAFLYDDYRGSSYQKQGRITAGAW